MATAIYALETWWTMLLPCCEEKTRSRFGAAASITPKGLLKNPLAHLPFDMLRAGSVPVPLQEGGRNYN